MKKLHSIAFYALVTPAMTLGAGSVLADPSSGPDMDKEPQSTQRDKDATQGARNSGDQSRTQKNRGYLTSAPANGMQASMLMDAEVKTTANEEVGSVSDLIVDDKGQVVAVVVGVGGFLGMGEKDVAIGWGHVSKSGTAGEQELRIDVNREGLRSAPKFDAKGSKKSDSRTAQTDPSTLRADQSGDKNRDQIRSAEMGRDDKSDDKSTLRSRQSDSLAATDPERSRDQSGINNDQSRMNNNRGYIASAPANGTHASKLIGAEVKTSGDEDVGPVSDLIIDDKGQVVAVVVGVGGFLGMGEKDVAIGWGHVTRSGNAGDDDEQELRIDVTRDGLRSAPEFEDRD